MLRFEWTETVVADIDEDNLVEKFREFHPGKIGEILSEYLVDNPDEDECKEILAAIREGDSNPTVDYSDVSYSEA